MSLKFGSIKVLKDSFFGLKFCDFGASIKNKIAKIRHQIPINSDANCQDL